MRDDHLDLAVIRPRVRGDRGSTADRAAQHEGDHELGPVVVGDPLAVHADPQVPALGGQPRPQGTQA